MRQKFQNSEDAWKATKLDVAIMYLGKWFISVVTSSLWHSDFQSTYHTVGANHVVKLDYNSGCSQTRNAGVPINI